MADEEKGMEVPVAGLGLNASRWCFVGRRPALRAGRRPKHLSSFGRFLIANGMSYEDFVGLVVGKGDGAEGEGVTAVGAAYRDVALGVYGEGLSLLIEGATGFWLRWIYPLES